MEHEREKEREPKIKKRWEGTSWWLSGEESTCDAGDTGSISEQLSALEQLGPCATTIQPVL